MTEVLLPMEEERVTEPRVYLPERPLMTTLGIVEGDILTYLERFGTTTMRQLIRELEWPAPMVMMAVGALIREGLIRALRHELEVVVEPVRL